MDPSSAVEAQTTRRPSPETVAAAMGASVSSTGRTEPSPAKRRRMPPSPSGHQASTCVPSDVLVTTAAPIAPAVRTTSSARPVARPTHRTSPPSPYSIWNQVAKAASGDSSTSPMAGDGVTEGDCAEAGAPMASAKATPTIADQRTTAVLAENRCLHGMGILL